MAAADIGSNTAHLLVAEVNKQGIKRLVNTSEWLSLGEVVSRHGKIPDEQALALKNALANFKKTADDAKVERMYVFATEAMRRAANCSQIIEDVRRDFGIEIDLISPLREAELGLRGAMQDTKPLSPSLMVETGGGSVQAALCRGLDILSEASMRIGTGVLSATASLTFPARSSQVSLMKDMVSEALDAAASGFAAPRSMVACGGVARGIWRALHPDGDRRVHREELKFLAWDTARLSEQQIAIRYGVKPKRAATLLPGALIYDAVMDRFGLDEFEVSQFGVREGAVLELAAREA